MSMFVQLAACSSSSGKFDEKKDSQHINEVLSKLRDRGGQIFGITASVGGSGNTYTSAIYLITYEASYPIEI